MPIVSVRDHSGFVNSASGGIRHSFLSILESATSSASGPLLRRFTNETLPMIANETTRITPAIVANCNVCAFVNGRIVVTARMTEIVISTPTIIAQTTFNHGLLTHGPSTARSLHNNTRNIVALGSRIPASACTTSVRIASTCAGESTTIVPAYTMSAA